MAWPAAILTGDALTGFTSMCGTPIHRQFCPNPSCPLNGQLGKEDILRHGVVRLRCGKRPSLLTRSHERMRGQSLRSTRSSRNAGQAERLPRGRVALLALPQLRVQQRSRATHLPGSHQVRGPEVPKPKCLAPRVGLELSSGRSSTGGARSARGRGWEMMTATAVENAECRMMCRGSGKEAGATPGARFERRA